MRRYLFISAAALFLAGCQTQNPYKADSVPLPPAPAAAATHFDASAYPAVTRSKTYTYWCWHNQYATSTVALASDQTAQRVLAEQLEQHGLRPASKPEQCELKVQLNSQHSQRIRHDYDNYPSAHYGAGYGRNTYHDRYRHSGIGVDFPITPRTYTEYYQRLTLTFSDSQTNQPVWRTQSTVSSDQNAHTSEEALRKAFDSMLESYR
ncbi:MAG: DUF4136 domain-containing protein [Pseudomonas sp.]|nr:DUF4136 domain-containing protein [Pseudomonas sp.]